MKTDYDKIKEYLEAKGYEGVQAEIKAGKILAEIEAAQAKGYPVQPAPDATHVDEARVL